MAGGQMAATELVENYPGFPEPIFGVDLAQKMEAQAQKFGLKILRADVSRVTIAGSGYELSSESEDNISCSAVIFATGASPVKLGIPGELELAGRGVSYCAVCDGPFFRDSEVAVIGGGDSAVEEAVYLTRFASRVHLIHRRDKLRAVKEIQEKALKEPKVTVHWSHVPVRIEGKMGVEALRIRSVKDGAETELGVSGVFFYVGLTPNSQCFRELVDTDPLGFVVTDETMACSRPGLFAAGDVRVKQLRQISTAVGDGATAAYSAQHYLERH